MSSRLLPCVVVITANSGHGVSQEETVGSALRIKASHTVQSCLEEDFLSICNHSIYCVHA